MFPLLSNTFKSDRKGLIIAGIIVGLTFKKKLRVRNSKTTGREDHNKVLKWKRFILKTHTQSELLICNVGGTSLKRYTSILLAPSDIVTFTF